VNRRPFGIAVATAALVAPLPALASGFLTARFGGEHGHPTTENATAMYYNPAGLAFAGSTQLYLDGTLAWVKASFDRDPAAIYPLIGQDGSSAGTPADRLDTNSGESTLFNLAAAPFFGVVSNFGVENLGVGLGFYAPFGGASVWDKQDGFDGDPVFHGASDGSQRWWSIEGSLRSLYVTAAGAYYIPAARLSFGLGVNFIMSEIHTIRARNVSGQDEVAERYGDDKLRLFEGRSRVDVAGKHFSLGGGLLWKPTDDISVGASYQSQPGLGKMKLEGDLELSYYGQKSNTQSVRLEQELPDVIRLGGKWRVRPDWEVRLFGEFARWSVFERQCLLTKSADEDACALDAKGDPKPGIDSSVIVQNLERDWEDAFAVRAGGSYFLNPALELYVGLGYDGNAVPDETIDPALPDFDDVSAALGARAQFLENTLAVAGTYTQIFYFSREIDPRPRVDGVPQTGLKSPTSLQPDAAGKYERSIGVLNVNVQYTF
jgi:long-chain fatty acid transport protein